MNIRELAEQAGLKYHNWITNESNIDDGDFKYPRLEDYKKFAELVAAHEREECIQNVLQQYEGFGKDHQCVEYVKRRIVDAIRARSET